jgi:hypothetical protein
MYHWDRVLKIPSLRVYCSWGFQTKNDNHHYRRTRRIIDRYASKYGSTAGRVAAFAAQLVALLFHLPDADECWSKYLRSAVSNTLQQSVCDNNPATRSASTTLCAR